MEHLETREERIHKALNFDLDTNLLKQFYPGKFYNNAYRDIKRVLKQNGFKWRQGSGYCSKNALTDLELFFAIDALKTSLPWLPPCVKQFDVTDIGITYSLLPRFTANDMELTPITKTPTVSRNEQKEVGTLVDLIKTAEELKTKNQNENNKSQDLSKQHDLLL